MAELSDGSLLIVEDDPQNKVLRLFYDPAEGDGRPVQEIDAAQMPVDPMDEKEEAQRRNRLEEKLKAANAPPFAIFQSKVIDKTCYECHQTEGSPGVQLIRHDDEGNAKRIVAAGKAQEIVEMIKGNPSFPAMPPQGWDSPAEQAEAVRLIEQWVSSLKQ